MTESDRSEAQAQASLAALQRRYPLPAAWSVQETFVQDVAMGPLVMRTVGLVASAGQQSAVGSAAEPSAFPVARAYFELLERISIYEARKPDGWLAVRDEAGRQLELRPAARVFPSDLSPQRLRLSLSNGVALHRTWSDACAAARHELVERDRILRSFAGEYAPARLDASVCSQARALDFAYEVSAYELGARAQPPRHRTAALVLTPRDAQAQLALGYGFGCADSLADALRKAEAEALQRLAFLWDEALPDAPPEPQPTPEYHHDFYLYPQNQEHLHAWLEGRRCARHACCRELPLFDGRPIRFIDLTPPALQGQLAVAKAVSPSARRLRFGLPAHPKQGLPHPMV